MVDLTEAQIREILAGCEGVTPGPWEPLSGAEHAIAIRRNEDGTLGAGIHAKLIGAVDIIDGEAVICIDEDDRSHIARLDPATVAALCNMALRSLGAEAKIVEQAAETMRAEVRLDEITGEPLWFCSEADGRGKISEHTFVELAAAAFAVGTIIRITEPRSVHQE